MKYQILRGISMTTEDFYLSTPKIMIRVLFKTTGVALFFVWFIWFRPPFLGGSTSFIIISGVSMQPIMYTGDLAIVRQKDSYRILDVVAFRTTSGNVIHRIVGGNAADGFVMQGDNKPGTDPWKPTPDEIVGTLWLFVPSGGEVIQFMQQRWFLASLIALVVMSTGSDVGGGMSRRRRRMMEHRTRGRWS